MNVLSLFDGMSCGRIAIDRAGIKVDNYFASEIDKYAISVSKHNYPDIKHIGDVTQVKASDLPKIDLIIGGSPCQGFSFAGKQLNFDDPRSKLFFEYVRILKEIRKYNPNVLFLLENVKMKKEYQDVISEQMGVEPVKINSALVSAQNRERLYWSNIPVSPLTDKGILLKHIIDIDTAAEYNVSEETIKRYKDGIPKKTKSINDKSYCLLATAYKGYGNDGVTIINKKEITNCIQIGKATNINGHDLIKRIYSIGGKSPTPTPTPTLNTMTGGNREPKIAIDGKHWRKLTPLECERLQTVPDNEIICIFTLCLDQVKNYVSVVEQNPKLLKLALNAEKEELNEFVKLVIHNMNQSHLQTRFIAPQNVDMPIPNQIRQCIASNQNERNTTVSNVENIAMFKNQEQEVNSVPPNAFINITEGKIMHFGKEELHLKDRNCTIQLNGSKPLELFGSEIMEIVKDVGLEMKRNNGMSSISTMLSVLSTNSLEQMLVTYYLFVKSAITGFTQDITNQRNISVRFKINEGYTATVSNSQRYKMLGNGWTVDVIAEAFFKHLDLLC